MAIILDSSQNAATPLPVALLSAAEACERALRKVRAFAINDDAADPVEMEETLSWFDMIISHLTGTRRCYWLTPGTVTFDWPDGESSVVLADEMGADYPPTGILFPIRAWLVDQETGERQREIELCRRAKYEELSISPSAGSPEVLYIDRLVENQMAYVNPVPDNADNLWSIALEFQTYSRSVVGEQGGEQSGNVPHGFDQTWQLYLVTRLAAEIGDGPVLQLGALIIRDWRTLAAGYLSDLVGYTNREKNNRPYSSRRMDY